MQIRLINSKHAPTTIALVISSLGFAALAAALTGVIFLFHWNDNGVTGTHPRIAPPDWVVGLVWIALFAAMGSAYQFARVCPADETNRSSGWILFLFAVCVAFPFYTAGLSSRIIGLAGCLVTLALSVYVQLRLLRTSRVSSILLTPLSLWLGFACFLLT